MKRVGDIVHYWPREQELEFHRTEDRTERAALVIHVYADGKLLLHVYTWSTDPASDYRVQATIGQAGTQGCWSHR